MDHISEMEIPQPLEEMIVELHKVLASKIQACDEMAYTWMDDVLEDAKKVFNNQSGSGILPKTPAAKQKGRARKAKKTSATNNRQLFQEEYAEDDYIPPADKTTGKSAGSKKNHVTIETDDDDDFEPANKVSKVENSPVRSSRQTRAASRAANATRAATTSRAKKTRATKSKEDKNKSRSQEPIQSLNKMISSSIADEDADVTVHEEEWIQHAIGVTTTPVNKPVVSAYKTPIQNFNTMNVKEKAHAYEEIMLISDSPVVKSVSEDSEDIQTPVQKSVSPKTPTNAPIEQKSPETVVRVSEIYTTYKHSDLPVECDSDTESSPKSSKEVKNMSSTGKRKLLKDLPSSAKRSTGHAKPQGEPARARTRLRLKKKKKSDANEDDTASISSDQQESSEPNNYISSPPKTRRTRSQGKPKLSEDVVIQHEESEPMETETTTGDEPDQSSKPTRSTRTKTRQAQSAVERLRNESTGSESPSDSEGPRRVTRSRIHKPDSVVDSDEVVSSPAVQRTTRTKTRKRQHEEELENESRQPKRSCTSVTMSGDEKNTPKRMSTDSSSSEEDLSESPANNVVRPVPSFLHSLNKNSKNPVVPSHLNASGLKSFIVRNSPAQKLNMKQIQEKRKQELLEKDRKEEERLRRLAEENKKRMEEMRRKREEKMKKVQEMKARREQEKKMDRRNIEKRLAEKREATMKMRTEKLKEELEKKKLRHQKMEEAEERRKQEEEERRKKLLEQQEQEKFQEAMLQRRKEFEEQERLQKIEDEKRRHAERQLEKEREMEKERERLLLIEEEKKREWQKKKEEKEKQLAAERAERERYELEKKRERELQMKKEMEKIKEQERIRMAEQERIREEERKRNEEIKKMVDKHNKQLQQNKPLPKPELNKTRSIDEPTVAQNKNNDSYEMTPKRQKVASTAENYGIEDLNSGDDTDDDECPRKRIPDWAQGSQLRTLLIRQHYEPPDLDAMFDVIEPPDLNVLFEKKKARFNKRTSSAHWDTPILKPGMLGRV